MNDKEVQKLHQQIDSLVATIQNLQGQVSTMCCVIAYLLKYATRKPEAIAYADNIAELLKKLAAHQGDRNSARNLKFLSELAEKL